MTDVKSTNGYTGLYFTDTLALMDQLLLTLAGRYNIATIEITDELGTNSKIDGTSTYHRFNPAVGLNYNPIEAVNAYVSYNEGMRAPTAVELTCADPSAPCPLPNAFVSDPPLKEVVAKALELGGRGSLGSNTSWSAAVYRANLDDDIQFVSASASGSTGFFTNIPQTRRQGFELGLQQRLGPANFRLTYGYVDATYQSSFFIFSPNNSSANSSGDIQVNSGDTIPEIGWSGWPPHSRGHSDTVPQSNAVRAAERGGSQPWNTLPSISEQGNRRCVCEAPLERSSRSAELQRDRKSCGATSRDVRRVE